MGWLGTWKYRHKITIDSSKIDTSNLTHFPVTVFLNSSAGSGDDDVTDIFDELGSDANRKKIALTTSDGETQLYAEIEKWDDANETAILHVSKTGWELAYNADTVFYIYFDSSQADNTTYIGDIGSSAGENVWDSNFKMVQHMVDTTTSTITDSTSNNNDGTKKGTNEPIVTSGQIGNAQDFDGSNDYIEIPSSASLETTGDITVSFWLKADVLTTASRWIGILSRWNTTESDRSWLFAIPYTSEGNIVGNKINFAVSPDGLFNNNYAVSIASAMSTGTFYQICGRYDGSTLKIYLNDSEEDSLNYSSGLYGDPEPVLIGNYRDFTQYFNGIIDEVRISNTARSAAWIKATYNSLFDTLIKDYATTEEYSSPATDNSIFFGCNF